MAWLSLALLTTIVFALVAFKYYQLRAEILPIMGKARSLFFKKVEALIASDRVSPEIICLLELLGPVMQSRLLGWMLDSKLYWLVRRSSRSKEQLPWVKKALEELSNLDGDARKEVGDALDHALFAIFANRPIVGTLSYRRYKNGRHKAEEVVREAVHVTSKNDLENFLCPAF